MDTRMMEQFEIMDTEILDNIEGTGLKYAADKKSEALERRGLNPVEVPGIVVRNHGPFTWGKNPENAVYHSVVLEEVSKMNRFTEQINPRVEPAPQHILEKHYQRKHGPNAYYGQK